MAAEIVIWDNLRTALRRNDIMPLPHSGEFEKLRESLEKVEGALVAQEAGEKLDSEVTPSRLDHLVALLHEADDLLDKVLTFTDSREFSKNTDGAHSEENNPSPALKRAVSALTQEVSHLLSSSNQLILCMKMAGPLKRISQGIGQVVKELEHKFPSGGFSDKEFNQSSCRTAKYELIGREKDKDNIMDMLIRPKKNNLNVSVIPIVGSPGSGKSALVQSVFDDEKIKSHFDLRMWIQISGILDEGEVIREIMESCTSRKSNYRENSQPAKIRHIKSQNQVRFLDILGCKSSGKSVISPTHRNGKNEGDIIERRLRQEIEGKLYLLVLDDASIKQWSRLKDLLAGGAQGSQILVTTISDEVANLAKTKTDTIYELEGLSSEISLSLLKSSALGEGDFPDDEWKRIAESIVKSCNGIPLTIRIAGSLLCGKSKEKWLSFKNDLIFSNEDRKDVTRHILEQSYNDLPTRLKACIGYCSLFPEDFEFNKHDLISLWIAQGLVDPQHGRNVAEADPQQARNVDEDDPQHAQNQEEVDPQDAQRAGEKYFIELSRRYFFHDMRTDDLGNTTTCKMQHLLCDLAHQKAPGIVNIYMGDKGVSNIPDSKYKHVSISCDTDSSIKIPQSLLRAQSLRTLLSIKEPDCDAKLDKMECNLLITKLKCLRVLDLHDLGIIELSNSIGNLIHLRYLDLSKNDLVTLPGSVTKLYNLQTLKLNSCAKLSRLEGNYADLVNLKRFELDECDSLIGMPLGLERLSKLLVLSRFVVGRDYTIDQPAVGLKALKELNNLHERLEIELTGDWMAKIDEGYKADLESKIHLTELKISWAQPTSDVEKSSYQDLLEQLKPHANLKILHIEGYKGEYFPDWAMWASSLKNLVVVSIEGCDKCRYLPPFGALPLLKRLTLRHMANVKYVESNESSGVADQDAIYMSPSFFVSLEELTLHNFYKLKRWRKEMMTTSMHHQPVWRFAKLSKLKLWNCPNLTSMPLFEKVSDLDLRNVNQKLLEECTKNTAMNVSYIKRLTIMGCSNLKNFKAFKKGLGGLPHLEQLVIDRCNVLTSLASELRHLTSLKELQISGCKELDLSDNGSHNDDMASRISLGALQNLTLGGIRRNPWASLKSLRHLTLKEIPKMKSLPEGLKHVQTLKFLWISACYALEELPEWISNLTLLQHLRIESCPTLTRLPDGIEKVTSLMKVEITECPELMESCREHSGKDWHKIKHARILLHKSWRYGHMSELGAMQNRHAFNVSTLDDAKYFIIPVLPVDGPV